MGQLKLLFVQRVVTVITVPIRDLEGDPATYLASPFNLCLDEVDIVIYNPLLCKGAWTTQHHLIFSKVYQLQRFNPDHEGVVRQLLVDLGFDLIPSRLHRAIPRDPVVNWKTTRCHMTVGKRT
jgi:hypothetical protein